jgi:hypothetical protein
MANTQYPNAAPANPSEFIEAHAPFTPRSILELFNEYKTEYDSHTAMIGRWSEDQATAEINRRRQLFEETPSPENSALLISQSPDEIHKTFAELRKVYEGKRAACIRKYATPLGRELQPIIQGLLSEFRQSVNTEFSIFHKRWRIGYDPHSNPVLRAIDSWWAAHKDSLRREDWAAELRYPQGWENLLPTPDFFVGICSGNLTPADPAAPAPGEATPSGVSCAATLGAGTVTNSARNTAAPLKSALHASTARY